MTFFATKSRVFTRGVPPDSFLTEQVEWFRVAPDEIFSRNANYDIYNKVFDELGPYPTLLYRKAVLAEVERVLAGFESSWDWTDGVDTSRLGNTTPENAEAGAWQVSYGSRKLDPSLVKLVQSKNITSGIQFQRTTKFDHHFALEYESRLLRIDVKDPQRLENGPLYKGDERHFIRKTLRAAEQSIYPWLSRAAVDEYQKLFG